MIVVLCPNPSVDKILHLDQFGTGMVNKCNSEQSFPGGKGVHVGIALKELGNETKIIGFWGGATGKWIQKECEKMNISCLGPKLPGFTRTCITMLTNDEANNTEILEKGPEVNSDSLFNFFETTRIEIMNSNSVCVSGSWPANSPDDVYETLMSLCKFYKTDLWVDASGLRLKQALKAKPYGIHINVKEAAEYFGEKLTPEKYSQKLLETCQVAAITDGANGLFLGYKNSVIHSKCKVDNIISTVGSGDCLTAGLIHSWYKHKDPKQAALTATACGAANCVRPDLGMLFKKDVQRFENSVEVITIY